MSVYLQKTILQPILKGTVHPKMKILSENVLTDMSFQTHLFNTK